MMESLFFKSIPHHCRSIDILMLKPNLCRSIKRHYSFLDIQMVPYTIQIMTNDRNLQHAASLSNLFLADLAVVDLTDSTVNAKRPRRSTRPVASGSAKKYTTLKR